MRTEGIVAVAVALLGGSACVRTTVEAPRTPLAVGVAVNRPVSGPGFEGIIFAPLGREGQPLLGWRVSEAEIIAMESRLPRLLREAPHRDHPKAWAKLPDYRRQYLGYVDGDRRMIRVNLLHEDLIAERSIDWQSDRNVYPEEDRRFLQLWYDVDAHALTRVGVGNVIEERGVSTAH